MMTGPDDHDWIRISRRAQDPCLGLREQDSPPRLPLRGKSMASSRRPLRRGALASPKPCLPPPPGFDDGLHISNTTSPRGPFKIPRKLPSLPQLSSTTPSTTAAFPPRKSSVGARLNLTKDIPPLPALPPLQKGLPTTLKMNAIPRKAVGQQPAAPTAAVAASELAPQGKEASTPRKLKRMSSISSILSAYSSASNVSQDSAHRSSQGSVATKDSEPSLSPERDVAADPRAKLFETLGDYTGNPHEDELPTSNDQMENGQQKSLPPVPTKDTRRGGSPTLGLPANPRGGLGLPATPRSAKAVGGEAPSSTTPAPVNSRNTPLTAPATPRNTPPLTKPDSLETTSSTPYAPTSLENTPSSTKPYNLETTSSSPSAPANGAQPLWQRRASKSDASIKVPDLTLTVSHGSTGPTSLTSQNLTGPPLPPKSEASSTRPSPLPPTSSSALPGRNIRPAPPPPTRILPSNKPDEDGEMKKFAASVKAVAKRVTGSDAPKEEVSKASAPSPVAGPSPSSAPARDGSMQKRDLAEKGSQDLVSPLSSPEARPSSQRGQQGIPQTAGRPSTAQNSDSRDQANPPQLPRDGQSMPRQRHDMSRSNEQQPTPSPMGSHVSHQRSQEQLEQQPKAPVKEKTSTDELSPTSTGQPSRRMLAPNGAPTPRTRPSLSMVGEEVSFTAPSPLTDGQQSELMSAIMLFRRHDKPIADEYPVVNAAPLRPCHLKCLNDHQGFIRTKNASHSIACATCHVEDREPRFVCTTCSVRVCSRCRDLLEKHKDTQTVLGLLQGSHAGAGAGEAVEA
ncbi:hypothetical protein PG993_001246 [Apiospora rasikravindrae]|uniref:B box-type domain-containing protein n=1 Tax=Apiospora rasikravindrae TaxID=990691 RepID=A0ABR1UAV3_9PEZI